MMISMLMLAAAAVAAPAAMHSVKVDGNSALVANYAATTAVTTRQIGMAAGPRPGSARCDWRAAVTVNRSLVDASGTEMATRTLAPTMTLKGSRPGDCMTNRHAIEADIAARSSDVQAHVVTVAEADQSSLRAEIEATAAPSGR